MIAVETTVLVLLAAGKSERFGSGNKLEQSVLGRALGLHVALTLEDMPFLARIAIVADGAVDYAAHGFRVLHNAASDRDMASSVRMGVECARARGAAAVLIALADMPRITAAHIYRLFDAAADLDDAAVVASSDGVAPCPPVLLGRERFADVLAIRGDRGARDLIGAGRHVIVDAAELIDVDTREDLERVRAAVHPPELSAWPTGVR